MFEAVGTALRNEIAALQRELEAGGQASTLVTAITLSLDGTGRTVELYLLETPEGIRIDGKALDGEKLVGEVADVTIADLTEAEAGARDVVGLLRGALRHRAGD